MFDITKKLYNISLEHYYSKYIDINTAEKIASITYRRKWRLEGGSVKSYQNGWTTLGKKAADVNKGNKIVEF